MERYSKRKSPLQISPSEKGSKNSQPSKQSRVEINVADLPSNSSPVEINVADLPSNSIPVEINVTELPSDPSHVESTCLNFLQILVYDVQLGIITLMSEIKFVEHIYKKVLELLKFLADHNEEVRGVSLHNALANHKMLAPVIQKEMVNVAACETMKAIVRDLGDALFSVLVDEARDISTKEQMAIAKRYVDKKGEVIERFLDIEHVANTNVLSLKEAMENLFCRLGLSTSRFRRRGYDGASNMQGEFNGLKALILMENPCAYYVHCFACQLQLALVAVAEKT